MTSDGLVTWCEARLLNHGPLTVELGLATDASDADVVVAAVTRWGEAAAHRLSGAFAFAVDSADGEVTIARDALGLMPVFWGRTSSGQVVVSDVLADVSDRQGVDTSPDDEFLTADSLRCPGLRVDRTAVRGVRRVPPGAVARVRADGESFERWWRRDEMTAERSVDLATASAELRELLIEVIDEHVQMVRRRAGDAGPAGVAAHCSGGLDSTTIAVLAARALHPFGERLRALLSWSPDRSFVMGESNGSGSAEDERDLIERLATELDVPVRFVTPTPTEAPWLADLDPARFPRVAVARESRFAVEYRDLGVTHVLSGWGGDEFASFNGRAANRAAVRRLRWRVMSEIASDWRHRGHSRGRAILATIRPALPAGMPGARRPARRPSASRLAREATARERFPDILEASYAQTRAIDDAPHPRAAQLALLANDHLSRRIDAWHQLGRRFEYEYGYPLLDRRIVEWSLGLPPELFRVGDHSRRVFRAAVVGLVDDRVRLSEKKDPALFAMQAEHR